MKIYFFTLVAILFSVTIVVGQSEQASLLAQSPDGKNVKLVWFLKKWNSDIAGFDIKRKDGLQDWVKLNKEPIVPGISMKKSLQSSGLNKNEESVLKARLYKLLATRELRETDNTYLQKLSSDDKALQSIMDMVARDYEIALISGFAYTDHTITKKTDYQFGLFVAGTDRLLAKVSWNYGEIPDLSMVTEITSKATTKTKGIQVIWSANLDKMKMADVAGFNIYREGIRLNSAPIKAEAGKDPAEFSWYDKSAGSDGQVRYSISAESIFGIEGIIRSYTYDPADHPAEYKEAEVTEVNSLGYYFKEGISVKWNFPKDYEHFVKGYYVEKDNLPAGYTRVSTLLDPDTRSFIDKTPSPVSGYVRFNVITVYNDRTLQPGIERVYSYFPVNDPPPPQNLRIKYTARDKKRTVSLSWDAKMKGDLMTNSYLVYVMDPLNNRYELINENHIVRSSSYVYNLPGENAGIYKFYVSAVSTNGSEGRGSDTLSVTAPSIVLPVPVILKTNLNGNKVVIHWQYPDVQDLKGFRLYQGNKLIAGENELRKHLRDFMTPDLGPDGNYQLSLRAVSEGGVESDNSAPVTVTIPPPAK